MRARVIGGREGFLIRFGLADGRGIYYWWNVGGWGNTSQAIERIDVGGGKSSIAKVRGSIKPGQWYDLKVEYSPDRIKCYPDGRLVHDCPLTPIGLSVSSTLDRSANEVIVKLVNPTAEPVNARIKLQGVKSVMTDARLISLAGPRDAVNTFEHPDAVKPVTREIQAAPEFTQTVPATAVEFIRVKLK